MMNSQTINVVKNVEENILNKMEAITADAKRQQRCMETLSMLMEKRPISWGSNLGTINKLPLLQSLYSDMKREVSFNVWYNPKPSKEIPSSHFSMVMDGFPSISFGSYIGRIFGEMLWSEYMRTSLMGSAMYVDISYEKLALIVQDPSLFKIEYHFDLRTYKVIQEEKVRQYALHQHQQELEERKREEKRLKRQLKKSKKEAERIAKMTDEEIATAKVMADIEKDRLEKKQEKKDIAIASQFTEKAEKVEPTKTKKEKKRGNPYQKMLTLSREAGIKTINPDWVKWENENK